MASSPAADRAFDVTELAEAIFLELPAQQILVSAQRVCRQWKAVIENSAPLQQALLFRPIPSIRTKNPKDGHIGLFYRAPMGWKDADTSFVTPAVKHPITVRHDMRSSAFDLTKCVKDRVMRAEASWRRQLYVQPSAPSIIMYTVPEREVEMKRRDGVLVGQIHEAAGGYSVSIAHADRLETYEWDVESAASFLKRMKERILSYSNDGDVF